MNYRYAKCMEVIKPSDLQELLKVATQPSVISFGGGFPDPEIFPMEAISRVAETVIREHGKQALQYTSPEGLASLRIKLAKRMEKAGVSCGLDNLILIQGGQQGLDLVARMFLNIGDTVIVENPTFLGALAAFNPYLPTYKTVPMDEDGMRMDVLEETLQNNPNTKFIYTVPEFHNPMGVTMSLERRRKLIELANAFDIMVLEDSPYREIRYSGEPLPLIKSMDTQGRVIHLGSFSKILAPGLRLGWAVAEPELAAKLALLKMAADTQNSTLNMFIVDQFLELYDIDAHIEKIRVAYLAKKELMLEMIKKAFPEEIGFTNPDGGLFTWITLPRGYDAGEIMAKRLLPEAKVAYVPGAPFYAISPEKNHARMNYSCMPNEKIIEGITKTGNIFKECFR